MRKLSVGTICILCITHLLCFPCSVLATGDSAEAIEHAAVIPEDFMFSVSNSCSQHDYFDQVSADEDGTFAVLSRYTNIKEKPDLVFRLCYVDVYSPSGEFMLELSFFTEQDLAVELNDSLVNLYFYDRTISYDIATKALSGRFIEPGASIEDGTFSRLRKTSFSVGQWEYRCKKGFHGYTQLSRTDGITSEVLISSPGSGFTLWNTLLPAVILGAGLLVMNRFLIKAKKTR